MRGCEKFFRRLDNYERRETEGVKPEVSRCLKDEIEKAILYKDTNAEVFGRKQIQIEMILLSK